MRTWVFLLWFLKERREKWIRGHINGQSSCTRSKFYMQCGVHHLKLNRNVKLTKYGNVMCPPRWRTCNCLHASIQSCEQTSAAFWWHLPFISCCWEDKVTLKTCHRDKLWFSWTHHQRKKTGFRSNFPKRFQFQWATRVCLWTRVKCKRKSCDEKTNPHTWGQGLIVNTLKQYRTVTSKRKPKECGSLKWQK